MPVRPSAARGVMRTFTSAPSQSKRGVNWNTPGSSGVHRPKRSASPLSAIRARSAASAAEVGVDADVVVESVSDSEMALDEERVLKADGELGSVVGGTHLAGTREGAMRLYSICEHFGSALRHSMCGRTGRPMRQRVGHFTLVTSGKSTQISYADSPIVRVSALVHAVKLGVFNGICVVDEKNAFNYAYNTVITMLLR